MFWGYQYVTLMLASVIFFYPGWIEMKSVQSAQGALKELAKPLPDMAEVLRDGKAQTIALSELVSGDMVLVRPGSKVPC
jgi:Cu2+-exporting ATPase